MFLLQMAGTEGENISGYTPSWNVCFLLLLLFWELIHYDFFVRSTATLCLVLVVKFEMCQPCVPAMSVIHSLGTGVEAVRSLDGTAGPAEKTARRELLTGPV